MLFKRDKSDAAVVQETVQGNRRTFETLINRYNRMAYSIAMARLGNHADVEDAVQEAWLQAFRSLHTLREPDKFLRWFAAIVRNVSLAIADRRRVERLHSAMGCDTMYDGRAVIEDADLHRAVWSQVSNLTPDMREVLTLHYFAGMTTDEMSSSLGVSREAAKKRLQRARAMLSSQAMHALFEPARERDEETRKRCMATVLLLPLSRADAASASAILAAAPRMRLGHGLHALFTKKAFWLLGAAALLIAAAVAVASLHFSSREDAPRPAQDSGQATFPAGTGPGVNSGGGPALKGQDAGTLDGARNVKVEGNRVESKTGAARPPSKGG